MHVYRKISPQFWAGSKTGRAIRKAGAEAVVVAMYLMTCQHSNMLGIYHLPLMYMAYDTGLGIEGASKGLQSCIEAGLCSFDEASEVVWVHEMALYQVGESLKAADKRCSGIQREYDGLPECAFLGLFFERYREVFHLKRPRGGAEAPAVADEAPSKPLPKALRSQKQEQEQKQELPPTPQGAVGGGFEALWAQYPKKVNEAQARKAFERIAPDAEQQAVMLTAVALQSQSEQWRRDGGRFIPLLATWLTEQRWRDQLAMPYLPGADNEAPQADWMATRSGIEGKGEALGLGRWDQAAFDVGRGEPFAAYEARVLRAAGITPRQAA